MKRQEYITELKMLYGMALDQNDPGLALSILERGREVDLENIRPPLKVPE